MPAKQRILYLDYAKIIGAFLVVFAHLYSVSSLQRLFIYAFHLPLFFWIGGQLHPAAPSWAASAKKAVRRMLVPFVFFVLFGVVFASVVYHKPFWQELLRTAADVWHGQTSGPNAVAWFLAAFFWDRMLLEIYFKYPRYFSVIFLLLFFVCVALQHHNLFLAQGLMAFPFYYLGYRLGNKVQFPPDVPRLALSAVALALLSFLLTMLNRRVSILNVLFGHGVFPLNLVLFYVNGLAGTGLVLCLARILARRYIPSTSFLAHSLLGILGLQFMFVVPFQQFWVHKTSLWCEIGVTVCIMYVCSGLYQGAGALFAKIRNRNHRISQSK